MCVCATPFYQILQFAYLNIVNSSAIVCTKNTDTGSNMLKLLHNVLGSFVATATHRIIETLHDSLGLSDARDL